MGGEYEFQGPGDRLRVARLARGLSQRQLGDAIGRSQPRIRQIEENQERLALGTAKHAKLAEVLDVRVGWIIEGGPLPPRVARYLRLNDLLTESPGDDQWEGSDERMEGGYMPDHRMNDVLERLRRLEQRVFVDPSAPATTPPSAPETAPRGKSPQKPGRTS